MGDELVKRHLRRELRSRGVRINRLVIDALDDRVVISGEVGTYYEIQLIQTFASDVSEGREIVYNLAVVPSMFDLENQDPPANIHDGKLHRLRNRLNELTLATRLLERVLELEDIPRAKDLVVQMLELSKTEESD